GPVLVDEVAARAHARRGRSARGRRLLAAARRRESRAPLAAARVGRRARPRSRRDRFAWAGPALGSGCVRIELVGMRRQQRGRRDGTLMIDTSAIPIGELLRHGPEMTLIDRLVSYDQQKSVAAVEIGPASRFFDGDGVPGWVGIEYMAQAIAAHVG